MVGIVRGVAKNSLAMGLVQVLSQISTLILAMVLSRSLGPDYTIYTSAFSVATVLFLLSDFGLGFKMVIDIAPKKELASRQLALTVAARGLLGGVALLLTLAFVLLQNLPATVAFAFLIVALSTACSWIAQTFASLFTAFERMHYVLMTSMVERIFTVSICIVLALQGFGLEAILIVVLAGSVLYVVLSYIICAKLIAKPAWDVSFSKIWAELKEAIPYAITTALNSTMYAMNGFLLLMIVWSLHGLEAGTFANTEFYIAFNLVVALIAIPSVFRTALLPVITRLFYSSPELTRHAQQKVAKYMFSLGLPLTLGGIVLSNEIIGLLFPNYPNSAAVLCVLLPVLAISYFGTGQGTVLASAKLMPLNTFSAVVGAAVNLLCCLAAIPYLGALGAALAFTVATFVTNGITYYYMTKRLFKLDLSEILLRPTLAGVGMVAILILISGTDLLISLAVGAASYFALLYLLGAIDQEDTDIINKVLGKGA
ncbi:MAG: polysaccharide biosynthesis C-terminal domain-containing protein [Candidatus Saccharibacteria bacterium]